MLRTPDITLRHRHSSPALATRFADFLPPVVAPEALATEIPTDPANFASSMHPYRSARLWLPMAAHVESGVYCRCQEETATLVEVLTAFLLAAPDVAATARTQWSAIQGDGFALRMPGSPEFSETSGAVGPLGLFGRHRHRKWESWLGKGKGTFLFEVHDIEVPLPRAVPTEALLDKYCTVFYAPFGGKLERERAVEIRGGGRTWPGRDVTAFVPDGTIGGRRIYASRIRARIFTDGRRLLLLALFSQPDNDMESEFTRFADGLKLD